MTRQDPTEKRYLHRTILVAMATTILFCLIGARLYSLQFTRHEEYKERARRQQMRTVSIPPQRAGIFSANGYPLAISSLLDSAYMAPEYVTTRPNNPRFLPRLAHELTFCLYADELNATDLEKKTALFEENLLGCNRLTLNWFRSEKETVRFSGQTDKEGQVSIEGTIDGTSLTLEGAFERGKDFRLSGKTPDGKTAVLRGTSSILNRKVSASGQLGEYGQVKMTGILYQKPDFILKRKISEAKALELIALREDFRLPPGAMYFRKEGKRQYPSGSLAAHVVGYTTSDASGDNQGMSGAERTFNDSLNGVMGKDKIEVTNSGQGLSPVAESALTSATGHNIYLTINKNIQQIAEESLETQVRKYEARGGICVVMDIPSGAVLAMASYPAFDLNEPPSNPNDEGQRNQCLQSAIPPGSVMKIFTSTALLEADKLNPYEMINCYNGYKNFPNGTSSGHTVRDSHDLGIVPIIEAFAQSSNIAYVQLGLRMDTTEFYNYLMQFGFGQKTNIDMPWETDGLVKPPQNWYKSDHISISFGNALTLTPIQVVAALAGIANNGRYMQPHILKEIRSAKNELISRYEPHQSRTICSPQTSKIMMRMMEEVTQSGTGESATLPGYRVGGKTGTTREISKSNQLGRDYYYASFAGILPLEKPRLAIYAWIDDPQGAKYGGTVTAPVFRAVAQEATRILGIRPSSQTASTSPDVARKPKPAPQSKNNFTHGMALPAPQPLGSAIVMPDLRGKTLREVAITLNRLKIEAHLMDWGVAISQQPPPGAPLAANEHSLVIFGPPSKYYALME